MTTLPLSEGSIKYLISQVELPFKQAKKFFQLLNVKIDQHTNLTFRSLGARSGHDKWPTWNKGKGFNVLGGTTLTQAGTRKIRYGTDLSGAGYHSKGLYPGYVRKGVRRYTGKSKLLQASGTFRKSFKKLGAVRGDRLVFGSTFTLAEQIMSNPVREVLFVTDRDQTEYANIFYRFVLDNIKL